MHILAIETSCDDTCAAVSKNGEIVSETIHSQSMHDGFGGVVPEIASRGHIEKISWTVNKALSDANLAIDRIDAVACTMMPGLIGSLIVGGHFAKGLSQSIGRPLIAVNHVEAHVLSNLIDRDKRPSFPFLCLTVSGGHTQIWLAESPYRLSVLGETIDDAAGEAFDKTAKLLGLNYPGGPLIDRYASTGDPDKFRFAEPSVPGLDFSFSGLKTSVLYFLEKQSKEFIAGNINDICASVQKTIIDILLKKLTKAAKDLGITNVCIAGGVSANKGLRSELIKTGSKLGWKTFYPALNHCTDNAAMVAIAGHYKFLVNDFASLDNVPKARA